MEESRDRARWTPATEGYPGYSGTYPRVSIWHGTSDFTVGLANMTETVEQWTAVHGMDQSPDSEDEIDGYPHRVYRDSSGRAQVEVFEITGAGHATFVEPDGGCGATGAFFADVGICSADHIGRFFGITDGGDGDIDADADADSDADSDADADDSDDEGDDCDCECGGCRVAAAGSGPSSVPRSFALGFCFFVAMVIRRLHRSRSSQTRGKS